MKLEQKFLEVVTTLSMEEMECAQEDKRLRPLFQAGEPTKDGGIKIRVGCLNVEGTLMLKELILSMNLRETRLFLKRLD